MKVFSFPRIQCDRSKILLKEQSSKFPENMSDSMYQADVYGLVDTLTSFILKEMEGIQFPFALRKEKEGGWCIFVHLSCSPVYLVILTTGISSSFETREAHLSMICIVSLNKHERERRNRAPYSGRNLSSPTTKQQET